MCGLFGIRYTDRDKQPDLSSLEESIATLHHRGPDATATWRHAGIGLAHARLSLVDPHPRSHQPLQDDAHRYALVYNGEIYNFHSLRNELEAQGIRFRTSSDTEVLLQGLIHYTPEDFLPRLNGMFAFVFHDSVTGQTLAARDRFGMKPLYLLESEAFVAFASEIKAFQPLSQLSENPFSISSYLLGFGGPTKGSTFFDSVDALAPGQCLRFDQKGAMTRFQFANIESMLDKDLAEKLAGYSAEKMVDHMEEKMYNSVQSHMFADNEVGAYCSGGVDSSLLMAMAAKMHNNLSIFHANVLGPWSEVSAAEALSRHLKLDLNVVDVKEADFIKHIPTVMQHYEHPYSYHPNCAPFMMVSRLARDHNVKGLLSGEGSDELFLGYPWLGRKKLVDGYYRMGNKLRRLIHRIPELGTIAWPEPSERHLKVQHLLNRREIADDKTAAKEALRVHQHRHFDSHTLNTLDYMNHHLRTLLHRNDTQGMEASIESRFPFLDLDVVRTGINMPSRYKLRFSPTTLEKAHPFIRDKWVIRKVADRWLPKELSQRTKMGFWTTTAERMVVSPMFFRDSYVSELFRLTNAQMDSTIAEADHDMQQRLMHLNIWGQICLRQESAESVGDSLTQLISIRAA